MKTAIVLFNLGGPDSSAAIKPFLKNFFMDPNIVRAPWLVRKFVSFQIARKRSKNEAGTSYGFLGGKSPLLENTQAQARALEDRLTHLAPEQEWKSFIAMRYWHPFSDETVRAVKSWGAERIILLPLYPQFSTTTSWSSLQAWRKACKAEGFSCPETIFCCYPQQEGFVSASARLIREQYDHFVRGAGNNAGMKPPRLLFSAHGLPENIIKDGDPYQWQCEESARAIAAATGIDGLDWSVCYQSRVGRLKWIGPSTEEALHQAAKDQVPVMIYPHAFVSEHVETLVEIEIEYRELAQKIGIPGFIRVPTVSTAPEFIDGLANMILKKSDNNAGGDPAVTHSDIIHPVQTCPENFSRCLCRSQI